MLRLEQAAVFDFSFADLYNYAATLVKTVFSLEALPF